MSNFDFTPQGWECPKCKRVYSPTTIMCIACPALTGSTSNSTSFTPSSTFQFQGNFDSTCVFEPGGTIEGLYYPDFCKKCGKQKQYHKYDKYNTPKL